MSIWCLKIFGFTGENYREQYEDFSSKIFSVPIIFAEEFSERYTQTEKLRH